MFNNRCFSSFTLNYSYFSIKYHKDDTFTLAIGRIILAFWHLIYVIIKLEIHISISARPCWYLQFSKKDPIYKYDWCLCSPHLAQSNYYQAKW